MAWQRWSSPDTWFFEIASLLASLIFLSVLVALLAIYDGQFVWHWNGVTLNALVAVLSTATKTCLMVGVSEALAQWKWSGFAHRSRPLIDFHRIDQASRGTVGSLQLIWHTKAIAPVSLGAAIIVIVFAFDPFVQQVIGLRSDLEYTADRQTWVPRAERYSKGSRVLQQATQLGSDDGNKYVSMKVNADFRMQSAVLYGLAEPLTTVRQQMQYSCSTGNCTWDPYESLAICNRCTDVSHQLQRKAVINEAPQALMLSEANVGMAIANLTKFELPTGLYLDNIDGASLGMEVVFAAYGSANRSQTLTLQSNDLLIWSMTMIRVGTTANATAAWPDQPVQAMECGLYYCVNRYTTSVVNGSLEEIIEPTAATRSAHSWAITAKQHIGVTLNNAIPDDIGYALGPSSVDRTDLQLGRHFNISQNAVDSIGAYLEETFSNDAKRWMINGWAIRGPRATSFENNPSAIQALYEAADLNATFTALAISMSNSIRIDGDGGRRATGRRGTYMTYIKIRWPWMILPIALLVAAYGFVALTVRCTRKANVAVWKSSILPALAYGSRALQSFFLEALEGSYLVSDMEEQAKHCSTQLCLSSGLKKSDSVSTSTENYVGNGGERRGYQGLGQEE